MGRPKGGATSSCLTRGRPLTSPSLAEATMTGVAADAAPNAPPIFRTSRLFTCSMAVASCRLLPHDVSSIRPLADWPCAQGIRQPAATTDRRYKMYFE